MLLVMVPSVLVAQVERRHVIEAFLEHGRKQQVHPGGFDAPEIRIHHRAGLGLQFDRDPEHLPEGAALARDTVVRGDDPVHGMDRIAGQDGAVVVLGHFPDHVLGAVGGTAVRIDDHRPAIGEVLGQPRLHGLDHVPDGAGVVEAGHAHHQVGPADPGQLLPEGRIECHITLHGPVPPLLPVPRCAGGRRPDAPAPQAPPRRRAGRRNRSLPARAAAQVRGRGWRPRFP